MADTSSPADTRHLPDNAGVVFPSGWKLDKQPGQILNSGSGPVLQVSGDGSRYNYWLSAPCGLQGGHIYMLSFLGRSPDRASGVIVSGPIGYNTDRFCSFTPNWESCADIIVLPIARPDARVRMGQWTLNGTAEFKDISLVEVFPVYSRHGGIVLGNGERLNGNEYSFSPSFLSRGHAEARVLDRLNADFNTSRLVFGKGQDVVYHFRIGDRMLQDARVEVGIFYYECGDLLVEASVDRREWKLIGEKRETGDSRFSLPDELFPAREVFVRLRASSPVETDADNSAPGSMQVNRVAFHATLDGTPTEMIGTTQYAEILHDDEHATVEILDLGSARPGEENQVRLAVTNISQRELSLAPYAALSRRGDQPIHGSQRDVITLSPGQKRELQIPYSVLETGAWTLRVGLGQDSSFECQCKLFIPHIFNNSYGELLSTDLHAALWSAPPEWKVHRTRRLPTDAGCALEIEAAKGESEAIQLVVTPNESLHGVNFRVSELKNETGDVISADRIELLRVHYLDIQIKTDATSALVPWPDPLPPVKPDMTLEAGLNQPIYVRADIPVDARAGIYHGSITVEAADGWKASVPLSIRVFDFALPDTMTCETAFGFSIKDAEKYHKPGTDDERGQLLERYLEFMARHRISPFEPAPDARLSPRILGKDEGKPLNEWEIAIDWTEWDRHVGRAFEKYHFNTVSLPVEGLGGGSFFERIMPDFLGYAEDTPEYKLLFPKYLKLLQEHLEEKGWLDKAYIYWFDEPTSKDYEFVMNGFRKLFDAAPKIRRLLTESIEKPLLGGPNLWCPHSHLLNAEAWSERRALGEQLWWYLCTEPKAPYATLFIDHPGIEMRTWLWQSWQRMVQGVLIWQTNYWTSTTAYPDGLQNPYVDPMSWMTGYGVLEGTKTAWGNGDGRLIYPPEIAQDGTQPGFILDSPVTSMRMEMLRDGLEDYEYFVILKNLIEEKKDRLSEKEREAYEKLLEVPQEITSSMTEFNIDPTPLKIHRRKLAEAIAKLSRE